MSIADIRTDYRRAALSEADVDANPFVQFGRWFDEAVRADVLEPNAMTLATATPDAYPSARVVLLKGFDTRGFVFYTDYRSRKGQELADNPHAALCFFWPELERQVRIVGAVQRVSRAESAAYFASRPQPSRVGAWTSHQSAALASRAHDALVRQGHEVRVIDLYRDNFDPRLSAIERGSYFGDYDASAVASHVKTLRWAEALVFVFPQWWFNMPAILKGYFDRVWAPGVAFTHDLESGRILPLLTGVRRFCVITTFGSPWWAVEVYMRNPVRVQLKRGLAMACAPQARFRMLALYDMDRATPERRNQFLARVEREIAQF